MAKKCRICDRKVISPDMPECNNCWEIYSRLRSLPKNIIVKLLLEADINPAELVEELAKDHSILQGRHVRIKNREEDDPNSVGRVDLQDGDTLFITNLNMPFSGTMVREPFKIGEVSFTS